jgi:hypothetical protein
LLVESLVPDRLRASGQAGLSLLGSGLGGILSSTLAGMLLDAQNIDVVMWVCGCTGSVLGMATLWILPHAGSVQTQSSAGPTPVRLFVERQD